jgi:hypothetical protein
MTFSFRDDSEEAASLKLYIKLATTELQVTDLQGAIDLLSGLRMKNYATSVENVVSVLAGTGRRELKVLARFHDATTGDKFTLSIPGLNDALVMLPDSDFVDPTDTAYIAFKAAFEAAACTYFTENTVVLDSLEVTRGQK